MMSMPKTPPPSKRYLVGDRKWNEILAELLRSEHEEKDTIIAIQLEITDLFNRTENPKTMRRLNSLDNATTDLLASKLRRIEMLYALLAMRERPADDAD